MTTFDLTFRIKSDIRYQHRYDAFIKAVQKEQLGHWPAPTSFYFLESNESIDALGRRLAATLNANTDMFLLKSNTEVRYFGAVPEVDVLKSFHPNAKELGFSELANLLAGLGHPSPLQRQPYNALGAHQAVVNALMAPTRQRR